MTRARVNADQARTESLSVVPHIIPDTLHPAVAGKLLDGTTSHSGAYGTAQSDGRMYFYTSIKGSKPIKDPRIGAHFGSQRHKFKSLQLLEQETATHGASVYSVDGREWVRAVGTFSINNDARGQFIIIGADDTSSAFMEITGYFNNVNLFLFIEASRSGYDYAINGTTATTNDTQSTAVYSPLDGRFVDAQSSHNIAIGTITTPNIQTLKITKNTTSANGKGQCSGIELIAQDTTSTATKSQIQIPSQNVVSYGKKFTVSGTPHYDPFNGFTSGNLAAVQALIDTDTSLGLANWLHSGSYYRPYNGARVVRWVASDGTIKTSVNMMPPNAQNIAGSAISAKANASVANDTYLPTFSGTIDHSQSEVAKTFHWREFGNGSGNGGTGSSFYADASMLNGADDIAYVMDDSLTSLSGDDVEKKGDTDIGFESATGDVIYITFIGTGISVQNVVYSGGGQHIAQNLPYGTHVIKIARDSNNTDYTIDGVEIADYASSPLTYGAFSEVTFHQPKMPPIPEDAVIVGDFMLMADYVKATAGGGEKISKGLRLTSTSRDCLHNTSGTFQSNQVTPSNSNVPFGLAGIHTTDNPSAGGTQCKLPAFGTHLEIRSHDNKGDIFVDGSDVAGTSSGSGYFGLITQDTASTLGNHVFESKNGTANNHNISAMGIVTPIHTSHHYRDIRGNTGFETPFLRELVGGDRNMEQHNLIVTPDGKTWDELTRKTDYIGTGLVSSHSGTDAWQNNDAYAIFDEVRGGDTTNGSAKYNKDFAIGYDRYICLKDGSYKIFFRALQRGGYGSLYLRKNGANVGGSHSNETDGFSTTIVIDILQLKRGDYVQIYDDFHGGLWSHFYIESMGN